MTIVELLKQSVDRLHRSFAGATEGLSDEQLHFAPDGDSHSIAWIMWHAARIEDYFVRHIFEGRSQLWEEGAWGVKTGLPANGFGTGQTTDEAKLVRITDLDAFVQYAAAVVDQTNAFFNGLTDAGLDQRLKVGEQEETLAEAISLHLINHLNSHRGEVNTLRGMMGFAPVTTGAVG